MYNYEELERTKAVRLQLCMSLRTLRCDYMYNYVELESTELKLYVQFCRT